MSVASAVSVARWRRSKDLLFSPALTELGLVAGATTRPTGSMAGSGTPVPDAVGARAALAASLGFREVVRVKQVHGNAVVRVPFDVRPGPAAPAPAGPHSKAPEADALWTESAGILLGVVAADCVPVLVADDAGRIGAAHAGWQGTTRSVARALIDALRTAGADPARMVASLGPSVGPCCYSVAPERAAAIRERLGPAAERTLADRDGHTFFDLWTANADQLERAGVGRIEVSRICTKCGGEDTWSRRAGDIGLLNLAFVGRRAGNDLPADAPR